jgi:NAD(P)-dependent dehydrogenase (short-subunit alcohol dehydrogenase family)
MEKVVVVIGAGQIGQAIARRVGVGKLVMLADRSEANANAAAEVMANAGYQVSVATLDVSSREAVLALAGKATGIGEIVALEQNKALAMTPTEELLKLPFLQLDQASSWMAA